MGRLCPEAARTARGDLYTAGRFAWTGLRLTRIVYPGRRAFMPAALRLLSILIGATEMQRILVVLLAIVLSASAFISAGFAQAQSSTQPPAVTPAPTTTTTPEELAAEAKRKAEQRAP
jgi:hypothetical protein